MNKIFLLSIGVVGLLFLPHVYGQIQSKYIDDDEVEMILDYCYLHADRSNPVQDLVDKGLVSAEFKGDTCVSIKEGNHHAKAVATLQIGNVTSAYNECLEDKTSQDCHYIIDDYCANPLYAPSIDDC